MHPATWIPALLMALLSMIVAALPAWIAWIIAWRSGMPRRARRSFVLACTLLSYGVMTLVGAVFLPVGMLAVYQAPQLHTAGHDGWANAIFLLSSEAAIWAAVAFGTLASAVFPMQLHRHWPAVRAATGRSP